VNNIKNNKYSYFLKLFSFIKSQPETYIIVLFSSATIVLVTVATSLKVAAPFLFLLALFLSSRFKSLFLGFFLMAIYSLQFYSPHKYYSVTAIEGYEIENTLFNEGRVISYGVNLSNIFLIFSAGFMISEVIKSHKNIVSYLWRPLLKHILFATLFLIIGIGGALLYSPYFALSAVWTLQNSQIFLVAILIFYFYIIHKDKFKLFFSVVTFSLFLQFALSAIQFLVQSSLGLSIEAGAGRQIYYALDEVRSLFRVQGTFAVHNELAFVIIIYSVIIIPQALEKKKILYFSGLAAGFASLIMTQSRANWLAYAILIFMTALFFSKEIKVLFKKSFFKRGILYIGLILSVLSYIIIPRFILSFNAPLENAGLSLRTKMITEGLEAFFLNPFLGYGSGTNEVTLLSLFPDGIMKLFPYPVHQGHLHFLLEYGIVGAVFFVLPFYLVARRIINLVARKSTYFGSHKNFIFCYFIGIVLVNLYYSFQNHFGILEFPFVGLILGMGLIAAYSEFFNIKMQ